MLRTLSESNLSDIQSSISSKDSKNNEVLKIRQTAVWSCVHFHRMLRDNQWIRYDSAIPRAKLFYGVAVV